MSSRESSPARSRSPSGSRSASRSPSRSRSRSFSSSSSSSPRFVSATDSENDKGHKSPPQSPKKTKRTKKASPRSSPNADSDSEEDEPKKRPAAKRPPAKKKSKKQESEEGEISSEDNNSDMEEFDDGYDENLIGDDDDRAKLETMTEREREEILFKRAEDREYAKKQFEIRKKLKQKEKFKAKNTEISHDSSRERGEDFDAEIDYNNVQDTKERSQTRQKKMEEKKMDQKSSALSELKAKRQEKERKDAERMKKEEQEEERKSRSKGRRSSSSESSSGSERSRRSSTSSRSSSGSGSDTERFKKSPSKVQKYIETQEDMEPIRMSRFKFEKFVHLPIFRELAMGCFCRIGIGQHQGKSVYRVAEIVDVVETGKIYIVGKQRTNAGLKLKFGKQERVFRLEFISNQHIMPQEFAKWKEACEEANVPLPTIEFVKAKAKEIKQAVNYNYTSDDIDKIVAQKEKFQRHPINYAMTKARLVKEKDMALANGQNEAVAEFEKKLDDLEERAEELDKKRTASISSVAWVNRQNRKKNLEKAEMALQMEAKKRAEEGSNPFSRKKCNPRMVTKTSLEKQKVEKENVVKVADTSVTMKRKPEEGESASNDAGDKTSTDKGKKKAKFGCGYNAMQKEDLFDAHNFDIEIDVNTETMGVDVSSPAIPAPITIKPSSTSSDRKRSLNLDDYKKKRGLI